MALTVVLSSVGPELLTFLEGAVKALQNPWLNLALTLCSVLLLLLKLQERKGGKKIGSLKHTSDHQIRNNGILVLS